MKVFDELVSNTFSLPFNSSSWTIPTAPFKSSRDLRPEIFTLLPTVDSMGQGIKCRCERLCYEFECCSTLLFDLYVLTIGIWSTYGFSFFIWVVNTQRRTSHLRSFLPQRNNVETVWLSTGHCPNPWQTGGATGYCPKKFCQDSMPVGGQYLVGQCAKDSHIAPMFTLNWTIPLKWRRWYKFQIFIDGGNNSAFWQPKLTLGALKPYITSWVALGIQALKTPEMRLTTCVCERWSF